MEFGTCVCTAIGGPGISAGQFDGGQVFQEGIMDLNSVKNLIEQACRDFMVRQSEL